jgi:hypothetical protein
MIKMVTHPIFEVKDSSTVEKATTEKEKAEKEKAEKERATTITLITDTNPSRLP